MHRIIRHYLEASEFAGTADEFRDALAEVAGLLDCHKFAYLTLPLDSAEAPYLLSNYDPRWTTQYLARGYHLRDPVPRQAHRVTELFAWTPEIAAKFDPAARTVFNEADVYGIRCGVTVPLRHNGRSVAAMTFVTDVGQARYRSCLTANTVAFQFLAQHSHERLRRLRLPGGTIEGIHLSSRELECLEWASRGKSRPDIALITGLTRRQVARDIEHLKAKLGVRTTAQAVKIYASYKANRGTD